MATIDWVDEAIKEAVIRQAMEFWINPEIERRREAETLPDDFALSAAQVILNPGADAPEVRLNEEVKAAVLVEAKRHIAKGEEVTANDILAFDFRRNAAHTGAHVERAREFLDTAAWVRQEGKLGPFVDNLFSATELMAKGLLIWMPDESLLEGKSHGRHDQHRDTSRAGSDLRGNGRWLGGYAVPATPIRLPSGSVKWPTTRPVGARSGPIRRFPPRLSALCRAASTSGTPT